MKFVRPIFYILVTLLCLYVAYAVYISSTSVESGANAGLVFTLVLAIIAIAASVIFPIVYMISHPKSAISALIGVGVILVLFGIGYALSGDEILITYEKVGFTDPGASKLVGGALKMMYIIIAAVLGSAIFSEVRKLIK